MSAHRFNADWDDHLRVRFADVADPGASGTIVIERKAYAICRVTTAGAESRVLESAEGLPVGQLLLVNFVSDGGDLTLDSDDTDVVLTAVGQFALFVVTYNGTANVWKVVAASTFGSDVNTVTRVTAAAAADLIPVSAGANKALKVATPIALGTVDINTGDATTDTAIIALATALAGFGLVTHTWT